MAGKWFFEIWVSELGGGDKKEPLGIFGPWETEAIAENKLRTACKLVSETYEKKLTGKISGKYIDMKSNLTRRWDRRDEN